MTQHTLRLSLESRKPGVDGRNMIFIRYTYQGKHKRKRTDYKLFKNHWDSKLGMIKTDCQQLYPQSMIDDLYSMQGQFNVLRIALRGKRINYTTAFDKLLKKGSDEVDLKKFIMTSAKCKKFTPKTKQKIISFIKAIEKKLREAKHHFTVLTTDVIVDEIYCNEINEILRESNISTNTRRDYLQKLDAVSRQTDHLKNSVFKSEGLYPKLEDTSRDPVEFDALMDGINDIRTLQDLEAYLFWIYSFCLLGLDANDIVNLDESMVAIKGDKINNHYHPEAQFLDLFSKMTEKIHLKFFRKKSKVPMTICINLIPILFIRDWLHYLVKINRPEHAYTGSDRLRIYNFKTLTAAGKDDMEGEAKKKSITDTYRDKTSRMFGGTIQQTRHTVTAQGQENGMTNSELNGQLGHSAKGSLKHYLKAHQITKDVNHIHIIQEFGMLSILNCLMHKTDTMTELINSAEVRFQGWDRSIFSDTPTRSAIRAIVSEELTLWSVEDEKRYQTLLSKESKGKWQIIDGVNTKVEVTAKMFSEELKELIQKKETIINDLNEKQRQDARANFKIKRPKQYKFLRELEEFEKTNPTEIEWKEWYKNNPFLSELEQLSKKTPTEEIAGASS